MKLGLKLRSEEKQKEKGGKRIKGVVVLAVVGGVAVVICSP